MYPYCHQARIQPSPPPMDPWCRSNITFQRMEGLIHRSLLQAWTSIEEWLLPSDKDLPSPPIGYVVSFAHFHEHGFVTPVHKFLWGYCIITRSSYSISTPTGFSTRRCSSPCARGSYGSAPTSICGGTSSLSPSRRRGRRAAGRSCI